MPRLARLVPVVLLALAAVTTSARADKLGLIIAGEPAKQPVIETTLEPWLKARGYQVELRVSDSKVADKLVDCFIITDQRCGEAAVAKLKLPGTLFVMVEVHHDTGANTDEVKLTGWLYDGKGLSIASQSVFCRACRNDTLAPTIEDLAKALFAVAGEGTGRVVIKSTPPGAVVRVDGAESGATPWDQGVRTGLHTITVEKRGYETHTEQIEVKKDQSHEVAVTLKPIVVTTRQRPRWPLYTGAIVGGALIATGAVLFIVDQDCPDNLIEMPGGSCDVSPQTPEYRDTAPLGVTAIAVGAAALTAGVVYYLVQKPTSSTTAAAWIDPGHGGGLSVIGRF